MMHTDCYKTGIDVGSTTLKIVVLNPANDIIHTIYRRHKADIQQVFCEELLGIVKKFPGATFQIAICGSAGLGIAERTGIPFIQEIIAAIEVVKRHYPHTRTLIDLGGEDSKMVFFAEDKHPDISMNGSCAGGTGAFIDQMADLMHISLEELGQQALKYKKIYTVASRCGVFAKTDVQSLISRNIELPDIAISILHTVALQCITSLARGRDILPDMLCIGGPLTFLKGLRDSFRQLLKVDENELILPEHSVFFPAWGAALLAPTPPKGGIDINTIITKSNVSGSIKKNALPPLFNSADEYVEWKHNRHIKPLRFAPLSSGSCTNNTAEKEPEEKPLFLGIDSGSTTTKMLILDENENIVYSFYQNNEGHPLQTAVEGLRQFYDEAAEKGVSFRFVASAATG